MRKISRKGLINKLDRIFSEYIRKRDADKKGICKCITCQREFKWNELDAGHFISRKEMSVRWDERNVAAQCQYCNRFRYGRQYQFSLALDKQSRGLSKRLYNKSKEIVKYSMNDLHELVDLYKEKLHKENKRLSL
jgi:hypothetical protein